MESGATKVPFGLMQDITIRGMDLEWSTSAKRSLSFLSTTSGWLSE